MSEQRFDDFLLPGEEQSKDKVISVKIADIESNPYQPRRSFPEDKIGELIQSIKTYGLLQPVIVRRAGRRYQLVAGERRVIACKKMGWKSMAATVKNLSDSAMAAVALIENLQRENLNYIEEAAGYARLMEAFNLTQEVLAQRLGKSQSTIANKLRLLKLPDPVKRQLVSENLTERHARALLKLESGEEQQQVLREIVSRGLTVNQTERRIESIVRRDEDHEPRKQARGMIRDTRIFLNTIREAIKIIEDSGLSPEVEEKVEPECIEVTIRLFKS